MWIISERVLKLHVNKIFRNHQIFKCQSKSEPKSGAARAPKVRGVRMPNLPPIFRKFTFYCIFMWQFFGISKVRGVSWPLWPPSYVAPGHQQSTLWLMWTLAESSSMAYRLMTYWAPWQSVLWKPLIGVRLLLLLHSSEVHFGNQLVACLPLSKKLPCNLDLNSTCSRQLWAPITCVAIPLNVESGFYFDISNVIQ